jgi:hypothetical protein
MGFLTRSAALVAIALMLVTSAQVLPLAGPGAASAPPEVDEARGGWTVRGFSEAQPPVSVIFEESATNATFHVPIPRSGAVLGAQITIEGEPRYSLKGAPSNFSENPAAGHAAYWYEDGKWPPANSPTTYKAVGFIEPDEADVSALDGQTFDSSTSWQNNPPPHQRPYHLFDFRVNSTDMARLKVEWHGFGVNPENATNTHGAELWIWSPTFMRWTKLGSYALNDPDDVVRELGATLMDPYDYVSSANRASVLAFGQQDEPMGGWPSLGQVSTDYVALTVLRNDTLQRPEGASLAIDNGTALWRQAGALAGQVTLGASEGLGAALQAYVNAQSPGPGNVSVPLTFRVDSPTFAAVRVRAIAIVVREPDNRAPAFLGAGEATLVEDQALADAFDLWDHFDDDLQGHDLAYAVEWEENASAVHATMAQDGHHVDLAPVAHDFAGRVAFCFSAADAWGLRTVSTRFNVTVTDLNDPPSLDPVPSQYPQEDVPFELNVTAHDPDVVVGDVLTFTDDTLLFDIDPATGRIAFTPTQEQVGTWFVNVTVADRAGARARVAFTVYVAESNDAPTVVDPGVLIAYEDAYFSYNLTVIDPDLHDSPIWVLVGGVGSMSLGMQSGRITWVPRTEHVGWHNVTVTATDRRGASSQLRVTIHVLNVNDPPALESPPAARLKEGVEFSTALRVTDEDIGVDPAEALRFTVDPPMLAIAPNGTVDFTPGNGDVGVHRLNVTVLDAAGRSASVWWDVSVENVNQLPVVEQLPDQTWTEGVPVLVQVVAHDLDMGDTITFLDSTSMFTIDPATGLINFTPRQADVGPHVVTVRVVDSTGAEARMVFATTVVAVNDPPAVTIRADTGKERLREGGLLSLAAVVSDEDTDRDDISFVWTFDGREMGTSDSMVLERLRPGRHNATVSVSDGSLSATASYEFVVDAVKERSHLLGTLVGLAVLAVVLVVVYQVGWPIIRKLMKGDGQQQQPPPSSPPQY